MNRKKRKTEAVYERREKLKGTTKLINPRGRVVIVPVNDVRKLLKRGFTYLPRDRYDIEYSHVHDKGPLAERGHEVYQQRNSVDKVEEVGESLDVEIV